MAFRVMQDIWNEVYGTDSPPNRDINDDVSFYDGAEGDDESDIDEDILINRNDDEENENDDPGPSRPRPGPDITDNVDGDIPARVTPTNTNSNSDYWTSELSNVTVSDFQPYENLLLHDLGPDAEPIDYFSLFITEEFLENCVRETNLYAEQQQQLRGQRDERWEPCSVAEIKVFLYVNIYFGIKELPHYSHYFSEHPLLHTEAVAKVITKQRYEKLSQYFHLHDNLRQVPRGHPDHDPLFKIRPLLDLVTKTSRELYRPGRDISFDEAMIRYTGRLFFKQYIRGKPTPWGVKVWCAADPRNGYLLDFSIYTGKSTDVGEEGLGHHVIMKLGERFLDRGHCFYYDNFFSSVKLADDLLQRGTYSCATIRPNRKGWPRDLNDPKQQKGTSRMRQRGNMVATSWVDKRPVRILSTTSNPTMSTVRRRTKAGPVQKQIPQSVVDYNKSMGGVDLHDQLRSYYPVGRRSKKWWRSCVWFLVQVSIINSWLIFKKSNPGKKLSHLDFRLAVCTSLVQNNSVRKRRRKDHISIGGFASSDPVEHDATKLFGRKKGCVWCRKTGKKTASNRIPETVYGCVVCKVHLCKDYCFAAFHNELKQ